MKKRTYWLFARINSGSRILCALFLLFVSNSRAQRVEAGISFAINSTFFHKSASVYDDKHSSTLPVIRGGVFVPVFIKLKDNWTLRTGLGMQLREYSFRQGAFEVPGLKGYSFLKMRFRSWEIPALFCFHPKTFRNKLRPEIGLGCVLSQLVTVQTGAGYRLEGNSALRFGVESPEPNWNPVFSPEPCLIIGFSRMKDHLRKFQVSLCYQYGLVPVNGNTIITKLSDSRNDWIYNSYLKPTLSSLTLHFSFFPYKFKKRKSVSHR